MTMYKSTNISIEILPGGAARINFPNKVVVISMRELEELKDMFRLTDLKDQFPMFKNDQL